MRPSLDSKGEEEMNGSEKMIATSMSGLMQLGIDEDHAFRLIEDSDYCINADWDLVTDYLYKILNGTIVPDLPKPTDLPEDLFKI